jgi:hypothetical protein
MLNRPVIFALLGVALLTLSVRAQAQEGTPANVRGTIAAVTNETLVVKSREGPLVTMSLPADVVISAGVKKSLADIKPGDYVGTTAVPGPDGALHAKEVRIFPEALRGRGDGHHPYDYAPQSTMTNGTVEGVATAAEGGHLVLKSKDGTTAVEIDPTTLIVASVPGDRSLLKPGAAVAVSVLIRSDEHIVARRINAEKDGVKPLI